jgi:hypothetical protein
VSVTIGTLYNQYRGWWFLTVYTQWYVRRGVGFCLLFIVYCLFSIYIHSLLKLFVFIQYPFFGAGGNGGGGDKRDKRGEIDCPLAVIDQTFGEMLTNYARQQRAK